MALVEAFARALRREMTRSGNQFQVRLPRRNSTLEGMFPSSLPSQIVKELPGSTRKCSLLRTSTISAQKRRTIVSKQNISKFSARSLSFVSPLSLNPYNYVFFIPRYLYGVLFGGALFFGITLNMESNDRHKVEEAREFVASFPEKLQNGQFEDVIPFLSNSGIMVVGQSDAVISEAVKLLLNCDPSDPGHVESVLFLTEVCKQLPLSRSSILYRLNMRSFIQKIQKACYYDKLNSATIRYQTLENPDAALYDVPVDKLPWANFGYREEWEKRTKVLGKSVVRIYLPLITELSKDESIHPTIAETGLIDSLMAYEKRKGLSSAEYFFPLCLSLSRTEVGRAALFDTGAASLVIGHLIFQARENEQEHRVYLETLNKNELLSNLLKSLKDESNRREFLGALMTQIEPTFSKSVFGLPKVQSAINHVLDNALEYDDKSERRWASWREWATFFPFLTLSVLYASLRGHSRNIIRKLGMEPMQVMWTASWRAVVGSTIISTAFYLGNNDPFFYGKDSLRHVSHGGWTGFQRLFGLSDYCTSKGPEFKYVASLCTSAASIAALLGLQLFSPFTIGQLLLLAPPVISPFNPALRDFLLPDMSKILPFKVNLLNYPLLKVIDEQSKAGNQI